MIRDLLNQKKKGEISHFGWGGDLDKFGSFSHFFFTFSNSCKYAKKGIFCGGFFLDISLFCYPNYVGL